MKRNLILITLAIVLITGISRATDPLNLPVNYDIVMLAGADYSLIVQFKNSSGATINVANNNYASQFRSAPAPGGAVFASFSTFKTGDPAYLNMKLSKAQTTNLSGKSGVWDLKQTAINGIVTYPMSGKATVKPTVTR